MYACIECPSNMCSETSACHFSTSDIILEGREEDDTYHAMGCTVVLMLLGES